MTSTCKKNTILLFPIIFSFTIHTVFAQQKKKTIVSDPWHKTWYMSFESEVQSYRFLPAQLVNQRIINYGNTLQHHADPDTRNLYYTRKKNDSTLYVFYYYGGQGIQNMVMEKFQYHKLSHTINSHFLASNIQFEYYKGTGKPLSYAAIDLFVQSDTNNISYACMYDEPTFRSFFMNPRIIEKSRDTVIAFYNELYTIYYATDKSENPLSQQAALLSRYMPINVLALQAFINYKVCPSLSFGSREEDELMRKYKDDGEALEAIKGNLVFKKLKN